MLRWFKTIVWVLIITLALGVLTPPTFAQEPTTDETDVAFQKLIASIAKFHEKRLKIDYPKKLPLLQFIIPDDVHPRERDAYGAQYDEEKNLIYVNPRYKECDITPLLDDLETAPEQDDNNDPKFKHDWWCKHADIRELFSHELGHFFVDHLIETTIQDSWLQEYIGRQQKLDSKAYGVFIVREGIGSYFGYVFTNRMPSLTESDWEAPLTAEEFNHPTVYKWLAYEGGYALVKPIIDQYRLNGITYLLQHKLEVQPPGIEEVPAYLKQALTSLSNEK